MMSEKNSKGSVAKNSTGGNKARGGHNGASTKISEIERADRNILPRSVTFEDRQLHVAGQGSVSPVGEVSVPKDWSMRPNPKRDRRKEGQLLETHGRFILRYDEHSKSDLKVIDQVLTLTLVTTVQAVPIPMRKLRLERNGRCANGPLVL